MKLFIWILFLGSLVTAKPGTPQVAEVSPHEETHPEGSLDHVDDNAVTTDTSIPIVVDEIDESEMPIFPFRPLFSDVGFPFFRVGTFIPREVGNETDETKSQSEQNSTNPRRGIIELIFRSRPRFEIFPTSSDSDSVPSFSRRNFGFPDFSDNERSDDSNDTSSSFRKLFVPFFNSNFGDLPNNYTNSTSRVEVVNGHRVIVNETIDKESGNNVNTIFHLKVVHFIPDNETANKTEKGSKIVPESDKSDAATNEGRVQESKTKGHPEADVSQNDLEVKKNTNEADKKVNNDEDNSNFLTPSEEGHKHKRFARSALPQKQLEQNPQQPGQDKDGKTQHSSSYVYNNMNGKSYSYIIYHKNGGSKDPNNDVNKTSSKDDKKPNESEVEVSNAIRPPDISKDTRVNHVAALSGKKQGLTVVDPNAIVFDLGLVLKEQDSHRNI